MKQYSQTDIELLLTAAGLSLTMPRLSLVSFILHADHPTAEDIISWAKIHLSKVNTATVYNTLSALENAKIIKKIKFPHLKHKVYDHNTEVHHHFLDEESGKIIDIDTDSIKIVSSLDKKFEVSEIEVLIKGKLSKQF